jgi:hypothetical protein
MMTRKKGDKAPKTAAAIATDNPTVNSLFKSIETPIPDRLASTLNGEPQSGTTLHIRMRCRGSIEVEENLDYRADVLRFAMADALRPAACPEAQQQNRSRAGSEYAAYLIGENPNSRD